MLGKASGRQNKTFKVAECLVTSHKLKSKRNYNLVLYRYSLPFYQTANCLYEMYDKFVIEFELNTYIDL